MEEETTAADSVGVVDYFAVLRQKDVVQLIEIRAVADPHLYVCVYTKLAKMEMVLLLMLMLFLEVMAVAKIHFHHHLFLQASKYY